jgi:carbonic anhydrase/acetyltransferase-like protein (isoleucine patch superfamily)
VSALLLPYREARPRLAEGVFVAPGATLIGDVEIGAHASVWFGCVVRGDVNTVRIGAGSNIQDGSVIHVSRREGGSAAIGEHVTVGHMALIHACTLEDGCFIGMRATVMDGAVIEGGAMVAAGALVTPGKRVPKGEVWAGKPARYMREVTEREAAYIRDIAPHYVDLARDYREAGG